MLTSEQGSVLDAHPADVDQPCVTIGSARRQPGGDALTGDIVEIDGESFFRIENYDRISPFFISLVSAANHWFFISSNGALTAGRQCPENPLFPYYTVDKIHDSQDITGSKTILLVTREDVLIREGATAADQPSHMLWEPFSDRYDGLYPLKRTLFKTLNGNIIRFEETNLELGLTFAITWSTSERHGFVKRSELRCEGDKSARIRLLDGMQNLMPYGVPRSMQTERSVLVDAYKKNELIEDVGLGLFTLSAQPVDRPEPSEALKATTVWSTGLDAEAYLLSSRQLNRFRSGLPVQTETVVRAERGAYFVASTIDLNPDETRHWLTVAEISQDAAAVVGLINDLERPLQLSEAVVDDVRAGTERLRAIVGSSDGLQAGEDRLSTARHFTNVLFNVMRGGVFDDGYHIDGEDLRAFIGDRNNRLLQETARVFSGLEARASIQTILDIARNGSPQLERLCYEYLPLIFSRRHGDPSRPWNHFVIDLKSDDGSVRRGYQGNWRDIFQNWEALGRSYPDFLESMIAKFVNASTADGYNPYRITHEGIDWEVTDPDDPWSFIGYWGDHQIVYLLALLEMSHDHNPGRLTDLLTRRIFAYANVPYRIKSYKALLRDPHDTIEFDDAEECVIQKRVARNGTDGKLVWRDEEVMLVPLAEKLLVPLLAKLTNFIPGGGIWLNTQRPEWNDANNALVGYGVSMVTLYQLHQYLKFLDTLFADAPESAVDISIEVADLLDSVAAVLRQVSRETDGATNSAYRKKIVDALGAAGSRYRTGIYAAGLSGMQRSVTFAELRAFIDSAVGIVDRTIAVNRSDSGLYHAYNLLDIRDTEIAIDHLYPMLEGQVAVLSSGILSPVESLELITALRNSALYRADQHSYTLYPDRELPRFLEKNRVPPEAVLKSSLVRTLLENGDRRLVVRDVRGGVHFNGAFRNKHDVMAELDALAQVGYRGPVNEERQQIVDVFEAIFNHRSYTGRSGTFFGYEGLGSIYWHMVSKLVLAVQKTVFNAKDGGADQEVIDRLIDAYYDVRGGLGHNKSPGDYGAFPTDPYSHTPAHAGAQQPGMTGQVKEDILCRWGELGVRVVEGEIVIDAILLRNSEFLTQRAPFEYVDLGGDVRQIELDAGSLAFTYCQVPFIYRRSQSPGIRVVQNVGSVYAVKSNVIDREISAAIFGRAGTIDRVEVDLSPGR